ncbi:MAG: DUF3368 domain-containing protein [Nitrospirae bacterium]|nr:DUF3368 domain-containing protein [Nitrospirota bacterium]
MVNAIVDNTVLTNFALMKREDILMRVFDGLLYTTNEVLQEYENGEKRGVLPNIDWNWLRVLNIESDKERPVYERFAQRLGSGESACLSHAVIKHMKILTDDLETRSCAQRLGISVSGTIGVLILAVKKGIISLEAGNKLLLDMIQNGYYSPYNSLDKLL